MEREFLLGVDFNLYVDKPTYESWLNLLKGLVMAKERDSRRFRKSRGLVRTSKLTNSSSTPTTSRTYSSKYRPSTHRARSTSPVQSTRQLPYQYPSQQYPSHSLNTTNYPSASAEGHSPPRSGAKRSAAAAFSPTSATFSHLPSKRPVSISLYIPELAHGSGVGRGGSAPNSTTSHSPLESLQSFAKMSLSASPHAPQPSAHSHPHPHRAPSNPVSSSWASSGTRDSVPETLVTAYALDEASRTSVPQVRYQSDFKFPTELTRAPLFVLEPLLLCTGLFANGG